MTSPTRRSRGPDPSARKASTRRFRGDDERPEQTVRVRWKGFEVDRHSANETAPDATPGGMPKPAIHRIGKPAASGNYRGTASG